MNQYCQINQYGHQTKLAQMHQLTVENIIEIDNNMSKKRNQYQRPTLPGFLSCCFPDRATTTNLYHDYSIPITSQHTLVSRTNLGSKALIQDGYQTNRTSRLDIYQTQKLSMRTKKMNRVRSNDKTSTVCSHQQILSRCKSDHKINNIDDKPSKTASSRFNTLTDQSKQSKIQNSSSDKHPIVSQKSADYQNYYSEVKIKPIVVNQYEKINVKKQLQARKALKKLKEKQYLLPLSHFNSQFLDLGSGLQTFISFDSRSSDFLTDKSQDI